MEYMPFYMNIIKKIILAIVLLSVICVVATRMDFQNALSQSSPKTHNITIASGSGKKAGSVSKPFDPLTLIC
jgi:hypothetical protein